jgi:3-oxoacyl-[acyl-carrier-protein] synthase II
MANAKVFVTGMGAVTSLGIGVEPMFQALLEGKSGVKHMPEWTKHNGLHTHLAAPVPAYDVSSIPRTCRRTMSRMSEMATVATLEALAQAKLQVGKHAYQPRVLLCLGSTSGSPETMETHFKKMFEKGGPEGQMGTTFFKVMNHSVAANVASALGFYGPTLSPSSACATSTQAMIMGWELIQAGLYDIVIAGGADELHYTGAAVFDVVFAASRGFNERPNDAPRPFEKNRDGLVISEGAAVVILESEESARKREATKLAEFCGGMYVCDGTHMSQSQAGSMVETMKGALERSKIAVETIDYVNAHATGTHQGDSEEALAIGTLFSNKVPVSSLKAHFGHTLAACGALEVVATVKMMEHQTLIPTRNLQEIDPNCSQVRHLQENTKTRVKTVLSNNFAFGGINSSLILSQAT